MKLEPGAIGDWKDSLTGDIRASEIERLSARIRGCRICRDNPRGPQLPHEPRPVVRLSATATICIASQAPGTRVHATGLSFNDASGDRLRAWMGIDREIFYDLRRVAIVGMGFCFPGHDAKGGDLPPRRECAPAWQAEVFAAMPQLRLILAVGSYAHAAHLRGFAGRSLGETVADWRSIRAATEAPTVLPLPHPSWRNNAWLRQNPWFEAEYLPVLRADVARHVGDG
jgi:uracil-DNA glycosylase